MPQRHSGSESYRYGFIGAENDNEVNNVTGGSQDHEFRSYDPRLGRYKSLDPLADNFPWNSPYAYAENRVIDGIDLEGREYFRPYLLRPISFDLMSQAMQKSKEEKIPFFEAHLKVQTGYVVKLGIAGAGMAALASATPSMLWGAATWAANPANQALLVEAGGFTAALFYEGPEDLSPGGGDELGKIVNKFLSSKPIKELLKRTGVEHLNFLYTKGSSKKYAVIGRNMDDRVKPFAEGIGAQYFTPSEKAMELYKKGDNSLMMQENADWIQKMKDDGYNFIDIGLDPNYTKQGNYEAGDFYKMENDKVYDKNTKIVE